MTRARPDPAPTLEMTLDGRLLPPPGWQARLALFRRGAFWQTAPRGTLPALLLSCLAVLIGAVLLLGLLLLAIPAALALGLLALLARRLARPRGA